MKIRDLGLFGGLFAGGGLMLVGGAMMAMQPSNDPSGIMIVLGLLFFIPGFIIAVIAVFSWLAAKLYSSFGDRTKTYVRGAIVVFIIGSIAWSLISELIRQANAPIDFDDPRFPILAGTWGGDVASSESWGDFENNPLQFIDSVTSGETVKLLGFGISGLYGHIPFNYGFPWFRVEYGDGKKGVMWGGALCATHAWANGMNRRCPAEAGYAPANEAEGQEQQALLDLIEYGFETLPGTWQEIADQPTDEIPSILVIHPQDGFDNYYAQRLQRYYGNDMGDGDWGLFPEGPGVEERSEPNARQLQLTMSYRRGPTDSIFNIVSLDEEELLLSAGGGSVIVTYRRVADPERLISTWEEQAAERKRIIAASAPRPEIAKLAPTAIEGLRDAHEQVFERSFPVQSYAGKIRSGPGTQFSQIGSLTKGASVDVLAVTDVPWADFLWYRIRLKGGLEGYVAGALLCAEEHWLEGIDHYCREF